MIICKGRNAQAYQTHIVNRLKEDARRPLKIGCILFIVSIICLVVLDFTTSALLKNIGLLCLTLITIIIFICGIHVFRAFRVYYDKRKLLVNVEVNVSKDLVITIYKKGISKAEIREVTRISHDATNYAMHITWLDVNHSNRECYYRLSMALAGIDRLIVLLKIKGMVQEAQGFHNIIMKETMRLPNNERAEVFIEELLQSDFLVACSWINQDAVMIVEQELEVYPKQLDGYVYVYTDIDEISEEDLQAFPVIFVKSFYALCRLRYNTNNEIMILNRDIKGIIINPHCEAVKIDEDILQQLKEYSV